MKADTRKQDLIKAVGAYFRSTKRQIEPSLLQATERDPTYGNPEIRNIQVASVHSMWEVAAISPSLWARWVRRRLATFPTRS